MLAVKRPYVLAAAALAATSLVAVTPTASQYNIENAQRAARHVETNLVDAPSLLNVPLNLFYDLVNIPANEIYATQFFTDNLLMAGPWFVVGPTNLWGVDPGDPTHYMSVMNFLFPFTALSGMDSPETDFSAGLGQQVWGLVASELPTNASCAEADCLPFEPASPITGISGTDFFVWLNQTLSGQEKFGLFDNWFNAQYNPDGSYFFNPENPGSVDPNAYSPGTGNLLPVGTEVSSGYVNPFEGWSNPELSTAGAVNGSGGLLGGEGIPGTAGEAADGSGYLMPWAGDTYQFDPTQPFTNFFNSLMETPSTSGLDGTGIDPIYGDPTEIFQTFQSFAAGLMMFDPFTPGSPFCPGECSAIVNAHLDYPDLIKDINNWTPGGNPVINEWLADYTGTTVNGVNPIDGGANVPSENTIAQSIALLQNHDYWDFGNPHYTGYENPPGSTDLGAVYPEWQAFWTSLGFDTSNNPPDYAAELATLANGFSPEQLAADWSALAGSLDPASLTADWTALLAGIGL